MRGEAQIPQRHATGKGGTGINDLWDASYQNPVHSRVGGEDPYDVYMYRDDQGTPFEERHYDDGRVVLRTPEDPLNPYAIDEWREADPGEVVVTGASWPPDFEEPLPPSIGQSSVPITVEEPGPLARHEQDDVQRADDLPIDERDLMTWEQY